MEPTKEVYGTELPEPVGGSGVETSPVLSPETLQTPTPVAAGQQAAAPVTTTTIPDPASQIVPPTSMAPMPPSIAPVIADDADLIEKEWVERAKSIVAQTAHDPNLQTKEVSKMKADYMQKRYSKQLKLEES